MLNAFRQRTRLVAVVALVVSVLAHLTGGLRADATGLFTYSFNIGALTRGGAPGQFVYPSGMAVGPNNQIYVADTQNNRVQVFAANGAHIATFGEFGSANGQFDHPTGLAADTVGNILVADNANHRIQMFDANFNYVRTFGGFGNYDVLDATNLDAVGNYLGPTPTLTGLNWPTRVTLLPGTRLGVANSGLVVISDSQNHRIVVLDSSLTPLFAFGVPGPDGNGPGEFDYPVGVGIDASRIYVSDPDNHRIQVFTYTVGAGTGTAAYEASFGSSGSTHESGDLAQPYDVQSDGQGHLILADRINHRVLHLTPDSSAPATPRCTDVTASEAAGRCTIVTTDGAQTTYDALVIGGFTGAGTENGKFTRPQAAVVDALGRLLVLDTEGSRVVVFGAAHLTVQPVTVTPAGPVESGQSVLMNVTVLNDGAAPLSVTPTVRASLAGTLSIPAARFMNPGDSQSFLVTFVTDATGDLTFTVGASGQPAVGRNATAAAVTATAVVKVLPAPLPKMNLSVTSSPSLVGIGATAQVTLTLSNTGAAELVTVTPVIDVTPAGLVSSATMTASSAGPLAVGSSRTFTFNYTALAAGVVTFRGSASAVYAVALPSGAGTIPISAGTGPMTSVTVSRDAQPPQSSIASVSSAVMGSACLLESGTTSGWHLGPVTVVLSATDDTAVKSINYSVMGLVPLEGASDGPMATFTLNHDGKPKVTYYAVDTAGNAEASHELVFCIDSVKPTIERAGLDPAPNVNGWNRTPSTVKFSSKDDTSGQAFVTGPTTVSTNGAGQAVTGVARDGAGNTAQTAVIVNVDMIAPAVTCTAPTATGDNGWYKLGTSSVSVVCTATDQANLSGVALVKTYCGANDGTTATPLTEIGTYKTGPFAASATCTVSAEGITTVKAEAWDAAGNRSVMAERVIKIDRTPPVVTCGTGSGGEIWPPNHKMVRWNTSVVVTDLVSNGGGFRLLTVSSSEHLNWLGDGNTPIDMAGWEPNAVAVMGPTVGVTSGYVRAERTGPGTGRTYRLLYSGYDAAGNETSCTSALTHVPHDQGKQ